MTKKPMKSLPSKTTKTNFESQMEQTRLAQEGYVEANSSNAYQLSHDNPTQSYSEVKVNMNYHDDSDWI